MQVKDVFLLGADRLFALEVTRYCERICSGEQGNDEHPARLMRRTRYWATMMELVAGNVTPRFSAKRRRATSK